MIRFAMLGAALAATVAAAQDAPYAGQDTRATASLSAEDVAQIRAGGGWGLAKSAEFNGWPGPRHALDLADDLDLTAAQAAALEAEFAAMRRAAVAAGADYLAAEAAIDAAFRAPAPDAAEIERLTGAAGGALGALRAVHLESHLVARSILTPAQVEAYQRLRGYAAEPAHGAGGHDAH